MVDCCPAFRKARQVGTDNEGFSSAVQVTDDRKHWTIGSNLPYISYCPWCGDHK